MDGQSERTEEKKKAQLDREVEDSQLEKKKGWQEDKNVSEEDEK